MYTVAAVLVYSVYLSLSFCLLCLLFLKLSVFLLAWIVDRLSRNHHLTHFTLKRARYEKKKERKNKRKRNCTDGLRERERPRYGFPRRMTVSLSQISISSYQTHHPSRVGRKSERNEGLSFTSLHAPSSTASSIHVRVCTCVYVRVRVCACVCVCSA